MRKAEQEAAEAEEEVGGVRMMSREQDGGEAWDAGEAGQVKPGTPEEEQNDWGPGQKSGTCLHTRSGPTILSEGWEGVNQEEGASIE
jgi:hypothetical protein